MKIQTLSGAENLTDTELLAILIRTGTKGENSLELSRKLLYKNGFHNGLAGIHKWSLDELISYVPRSSPYIFPNILTNPYFK